MLVPFKASIEYPFSDAIRDAINNFPDLDFGGIVTASDLERFLSDAGVVFYIDIQPDDGYLQTEQSVSNEVDRLLDAPLCEDLPATAYSPEELNALCAVPDESIAVDVPDSVDGDIDELERQIRQMMDVQDAAAQSVLQCARDAQSITDRILLLIRRKNRLRLTKFQLDELLYQYRIMEAFFRMRIASLDELLDTFGRLVVEKRTWENELTTQQNLLSTKTQELQTLTSMNPQNVILINNKKAEIEVVKGKILDAQSDLDGAIAQIELKKSTSPIFSDTFTYSSINYRLEALQSKINDLFSGTLPNNVFSSVHNFSSRTQFNPFDSFIQSGENNVGFSFKLAIDFSLSDEEGVLSGRPNLFMQTDDYVNLINSGSTNHTGFLYSHLYNIWSNINLFFTPEERGLTQDGNNVDTSLRGTGAEQIEGKYIASFDTFKDFYQNFGDKWDARVAFVQANEIEPELANLQAEMERYAREEVIYYLSFGKIYEVLPAEDEQLLGAIGNLRLSANKFLARVDDLRNTIAYVEQLRGQTDIDIENERNNYQLIPCAIKTTDPVQNIPAPGADPLGRLSLRAIDPTLPNPTKYCYWVKFAQLATAVNLLPIPGPGGFKYWPIGFLIPTPSGLIKIPLPIIWIPLAVICSPIGTFVIFLGQCGICPSPFVLYLGINGEKKFIVSLRPTQQFGHTAADSILKAVTDGGIAVAKSISSVLNDINVPGFTPVGDPNTSDNTIQELKDKVLKKVSKLGLPQLGPIRQLSTGDDIQKKKSALKNSIKSHFNKAELPSLDFPRDNKKINPKPTAPALTIATLKKQLKLNLPQIVVPPVEQVNLKTVLMSSFQTSKNPKTVNIPKPPANASNSAKVNYRLRVRGDLADAADFVNKQITPKRLGIVTLATSNISFFSAYKCRSTAEGFIIPGIPPYIAVGLATIKAAVNGQINGLDDETLDSLDGPLITMATINGMLQKIYDAVPNVFVPNPSKISIKDLISNSSISLAAMQLPSLPDPFAGFQPKISISGDGLKAAVLGGIDAAIERFPINDIDFSTLTEVDLRQIVMSVIEDSFDGVDNFITPFIDATSFYVNAKDKTFAELLGLGKVSKNDDEVQFVPSLALKNAFDAIENLSLVPFPAVCVAPNAFLQLHPILKYDEIPPWERLTLTNFMFVCFLDEFCHQGKVGGGFFENPI